MQALQLNIQTFIKMGAKKYFWNRGHFDALFHSGIWFLWSRTTIKKRKNAWWLCDVCVLIFTIHRQFSQRLVLFQKKKLWKWHGKCSQKLKFNQQPEVLRVTNKTKWKETLKNQKAALNVAIMANETWLFPSLFSVNIEWRHHLRFPDVETE